jgi:hypothetical protein
MIKKINKKFPTKVEAVAQSGSSKRVEVKEEDDEDDDDDVDEGKTGKKKSSKGHNLNIYYVISHQIYISGRN